MNGSRSISRRKGYLLAALAAAVLLAASSGTAWAQQLNDISIVLEPPRTMGEGSDATITVRGTAVVEPTPATGDVASDRVVSVDLTLATSDAVPGSTPGEFNEAGQVDDAGIVANPRVQLVFAENTGSTARRRTATGTSTVRANEDADAEHERVMVSGVASGGGNASTRAPDAVSFSILDDETQKYVLTLNDRIHTSSNPPREGEDIEVTLKARPAHYEGGSTLTLQLSKGGGRATGYAATGEGANSAGSIAIGTTNPDGGAAIAVVNTRSITIEQGHDADNGDGNRETDVITLEAHSGPAGRDSLADSLDIDVLDIHMLPAASGITAVAKDEDGNVVTEVMEGGDPVYLTITVDRRRGSLDGITGEELTVNIRPADRAQVADYDLSESRIVLESRSSGQQTNDVDLEIGLSARSDEDVGMEYLMLNLEVSGDSDIGTETSTGTFTISLVDNTMKKVEPKSEEETYPAIMAAIEAGAGAGGLNPGESFTIMTSDLFTVAEGYTAAYAVSAEGGAVSVSASSDSATVTANEPGESKVTVTATATMETSSFIPSQTVSNIAEITFPVTVADKVLVVTLEMPDGVMNGNIVEGSSYDINVVANRAVSEDTEVMISRDRADSDAGDDDFSVSSATIMAGDDSATAEMMVTEDNMPDSGAEGSMGEVLVLFGTVNGEQTNALTFTIWDMAVPALPVIAQLLLALFMMAGGARLYRRRQG